jgi:hypothetical protein
MLTARNMTFTEPSPAVQPPPEISKRRMLSGVNASEQPSDAGTLKM